jgi:transposase, IS5 family
VTPQIKREFKRRSAIEPVIGHLKDDHRMRRNHLAHASGDAINAVLAAAGYNFRRLIRWLSFLLLRILFAFRAMAGPPSAQTGLNAPFFTGDEVGAADGSMSWLIAFDIVNIRNNVVRAYCPEVSTIRKRASPLIIRS